MVWAVPNADAVTLGEMGGELYSVTPRDEHHLGDEFVRRGGAVFPPARVTNLKQRRPFDQQQSLTQRELDGNDDDDELHDLSDPHAVRLAKRALRVLRHFFVDDEQKIVRVVMDTATRVAKDVMVRAVGDDHEDASAFTEESAIRVQRQETIATIAWHPTLLLLAVAQRDGVVAFFNVATGAWDSRVLDHPAQQEITSVQWATFSGGVVAVACRAGVLLWKVSVKHEHHEPELLQVMTHPTKKAFYQVSWSEDGSLLAAFADHTDLVFIYDTHFQRRSELKCYEQVASIQWSPTGEYLFVATTSGVSLMWETLTWKKEIWDLATGSCAWSSNGRCLLVAPRKGSHMFPYEFRAGPPSISVCMNTPAVDFSEKELTSIDKSTIEHVGGTIHSLAWDPTSTRVAITYKSPTPGPGNEVGPLVAIFSVAWTPFLIFTRSGLIRGPPNAGVPRHVAFAASFEKGALLSIAWSSGLVTFHPFYFDEE